MSNSTFGNRFKVTTWGESHGTAMGVVVDGCPAGLELTEEYVQEYLNRRKPGQSKFTTARKEGDEVHILSGVFEGKTTGTPISMMVYNKDHRSTDYGDIAYVYRPGHADYTFDQKYGIRDYRGGGRSSGRETLGRVAAGAIAAKILKELGVDFITYVSSIGPISIETFNPSVINENSLSMPDTAAAEKASAYINKCLKNQDSSGATIECRINGVPAGLGDPVFGKLDAMLAQAVMSIGAVKAVEIGDGINVSRVKGSENNDEFCVIDGKIAKKTNHSGGILGGMSDGSEILIRASVKPTPSIARPQQTVTMDGEPFTIEIKGRHDPIIAPRACVVVECMCAITILDALMCNMSSRMDNLHRFYDKK